MCPPGRHFLISRAVCIRLTRMDGKLSVRLLLKYPGLTVIASLGIAVGVAICAGFVAFAQTQLYPTLPLDEGDRIVGLQNWDFARGDEAPVAWEDFTTWRDRLTAVIDTGAFQNVHAPLQVGTWQEETVRIAAMSASGFTLARVPPLKGRFLTQDDERADAAPVLVIGFDAWRLRFAQDPSVVGAPVRIGNTVHTVVGVMPEGFKFPVSHQYWMPLRANTSGVSQSVRRELMVFGRLAAGATVAFAQAELFGIGQPVVSGSRKADDNLKPRIVKYTLAVTGDADPGIELAVMMMALLVSLVLVVIAFNVAILVYARTAYRRREIAIRTALGAHRLRIVMQLSVEAMALTLMPAAAGLGLAQYFVRLTLQIFDQGREFGGSSPFWADYSLQPVTIAYVIALVIVTVVIVGVLPALQATRRNVSDEIRALGASVQLGRTWSVLIVAQVAIAVAALPVVLRVGLAEVRSALTRPSFPIKEFVGVAVGTEAGTERLGHRLTEFKSRLEQEPDIAGVTFVGSRPRGGGGRLELMETNGLAAPAGTKSAGIRTFGIAADYFEVYGLRILAGRAFHSRDAQSPTNPVIVDRPFVEAFLKGTPTVGQRFRYSAAGGTDKPSPWYEIVGVMESVATNPLDPSVLPAYVIYPVAAEQISSASVRLRIRGSLAADLPQRLHRIAAAVDPALRLGEVRPSTLVNIQEALTMRLFATGLTLVMATVLLLSAGGVYALMSFTVAQRRREIGIRTALGAPPRRVVQSIFSRVAVQVGIGIVAGIIGAVVIESPIRFSIAGLDLSGSRPMVIAAVAFIMLIVGFLAALGPVRRGLRIQPTEALKDD
jgi:putative ABC transport system permease protein